MVNGRKMTLPSYEVRAGDTITWRPGSTKTVYYKRLAEAPPSELPPAWLSLDKEKLEAKVVALPARGDVQVLFNESAIVEYYSR